MWLIYRWSSDQYSSSPDLWNVTCTLHPVPAVLAPCSRTFSMPPGFLLWQFLRLHLLQKTQMHNMASIPSRNSQNLSNKRDPSRNPPYLLHWKLRSARSPLGSSQSVSGRLSLQPWVLPTGRIDRSRHATPPP